MCTGDFLCCFRDKSVAEMSLDSSWAVVSGQQENFTAQQLASLLRCNLPGNSSHSRMIWKMLLTKTAMALDQALDILANMVGLISAL